MSLENLSATPAARRLSLFLKIGGIGVLIALLHLPLSLTNGVLRERQGYQKQATEEIAQLWGRAQLLRGPVLAVPYTVTTSRLRRQVVNGQAVQNSEEETTHGVAYAFPDELNITGELNPEVRSRGIYSTVVYTAALRLSGRFAPKPSEFAPEKAQLEWDKARLIFSLSDLHALPEPPTLGPEGHAGDFEAVEDPAFGPAVAGKAAGIRPDEPFKFDLAFAVRGAQRIDFAPVAKQTRVKLDAAWNNPSFSGTFLPDSHREGADHFTANWSVSHFGRDYPLAWYSQNGPTTEIWHKAEASSFGVELRQPLDGYGVVARACKYGLLFFTLVFAVFFLFEVTAALRIHPLQYALVGAALCLFFLAFLALTEFWPTGPAYAVAAAACTGLVAGYAHTFLRAAGRTLTIGGGLAGTYGYLYFVLKSQDYALLAGTLALFAVLALVMFCTRRVNWYELETTRPASRSSAVPPPLPQP